MLDFRLLTFMKLCELKSYTKTAENLHMTQPTVTQHVQYLERQYGVPPVSYTHLNHIRNSIHYKRNVRIFADINCTFGRCTQLLTGACTWSYC